MTNENTVASQSKNAEVTTQARVIKRIHENFFSSLRTLRARACSERGDVPGWVLICVMTAGLVIVLWAIAGDALQSMLTQAFNDVGAKMPR